MNNERIGVIGAGTMGNGIAQACAVAGFPVVLLDISENALERGMLSLQQNLERQVKQQVLSAQARDAALERICASTDYRSLHDSSLVIEAASENLELKLGILDNLGKCLDREALIASNTSSLSITRLAAAIPAPQRFIGLHFFNPVPVMALVEVIRGLQTSDATHSRALALAEQLGKTAITAGNTPGFVVNRILIPMLNEAVFALQEGLASAEDIDTAMRLGCNQPLGPLALADLVGLDTLLAALEALHDGFNDSKYRPAPLLKEMVAAGYLGRKSGRGFHSYA
ncbi:3-hydroxybutyryl-CoA dehydrogenase [Pseudomonas sp. CrR25]|nr:3-hydroxybutyryl-CoA dehydrogenase [Pseudomonas sp. CrR25]